MNIDTKVYRKHETPTFGNTLLGAVPYSEVYLMDCVAGLRHYPDNYFDLAVVDPPYGIDVANDDRFGQQASKKAATITKNYTKKDWDTGVPTKAYWDELFRVSKNQIVWGVNYFCDERLCGGRIFWDKQVPEDYTKSKGEIAYKSFGVGVEYIKVTWHGMLQYDMKDKEERIHPTQKPIRLYDKLFQKYAKEGQIILDTHIGSGSSRIAADKAGLNFVGFEIDEEYFNAANKRFDNFKCQTRLF